MEVIIIITLIVFVGLVAWAIYDAYITVDKFFIKFNHCMDKYLKDS